MTAIIAWFTGVKLKTIMTAALVAVSSGGAVYVYDDLVRIPNAQEAALALMVARINASSAAAMQDASEFAREIETEIRNADPNDIRCVVFGDCGVQ